MPASDDNVGAVPPPRIDLLGYGVAAVDELIELDAWPDADVKVDLRRHQTQAGGICVNALAAAARLGKRCHFAGPLGVNELSDVVRRGMTDAGVTFEPPADDPEAGPSHAFILVDRAGGTRTILMDKSRVRELPPDGVPDRLIAASRALYVDAWHLDAGARAVEAARRHGVQTIADFEEHDPARVRPLLPMIDHLILPVGYAGRLAGADDDAAGLAVTLAATAPAGRPCTAVTVGTAGCWYVTPGDPGRARHVPAFEVRVTDTTGCGDAFHGAYIAAVLDGLDVPEALRFAAAAAALNARAVGAIAGLPTAAEIAGLLRTGRPIPA